MAQCLIPTTYDENSLHRVRTVRTEPQKQPNGVVKVSRIAVTGQEAINQQQMNQRMQYITGLRTQIIIETYARIIGDQYQRAMNRGMAKADPLGVAGANGPEEFEFSLDLAHPAHTAIQAADTMLVAMGLVQPPPPNSAAAKN